MSNQPYLLATFYFKVGEPVKLYFKIAADTTHDAIWEELTEFYQQYSDAKLVRLTNKESILTFEPTNLLHIHREDIV